MSPLSPLNSESLTLPVFNINDWQFFFLSLIVLIQELKQYPTLRAEVLKAAIDSLERMKEESKRATLQLVDMECGYLTVEFFRKLPQDVEKGGNPTHSIFDRYNDSYLRRVGKQKYQQLISWLATD